MKHERKVRYSVSWVRHFERPPELPETLCVCDDCKDAERVVAETKLIADSHYALGVLLPGGKERRRLSAASIASMRRKRLEARLRKQCGPLFFEELMAREIAARPEYFAAADVLERERREAAESKADAVREEPCEAPLAETAEDALDWLRREYVVAFVPEFVNACRAWRLSRVWSPALAGTIVNPDDKEAVLRLRNTIRRVLGEAEEARGRHSKRRCPEAMPDDDQPSLF